MSEQDKMVLRAEHLVKKYGKRTVVNDVSFDVKQGEIVGLLGPNGAGKTTSFYMTTGLVVPNGGRIFVDGLANDLIGRIESSLNRIKIFLYFGSILSNSII